MRLGPSLHRIGDDLVAVHLIVTDDGVTVIDAGMPGHWNAFLAELDALGLGLADVRGLILTHGDSDHISFAERLRREAGVPVYVHEADAARARGETKTNPPWGRLRLGPVLRFLTASIRLGALRTPPVAEVTTVRDGEVLDLPGAPEIIGMPGHSPGSIAVHVPVADAVFVGDALTTRHVLTGETGPQPAPFTDDPAAARGSLDRLAGIRASWVLPGHGPAWHDGAAAAVREAERAAAAG